MSVEQQLLDVIRIQNDIIREVLIQQPFVDRGGKVTITLSRSTIETIIRTMKLIDSKLAVVHQGKK